LAAIVALSVAGCGGSGGGGGEDAVGGAGGGGGDGSAPTAAAGATPYVFVVAMENHSSASIYGSASAPYINGTLLPAGARADAFQDELPDLPSEPHYVWIEAGTNVFADRTFTVDAAPSAANSTASAQHLARQMADSGGRVDWRSYQQGLGAATGACPIRPAGTYVPRHDPFLFFRDVSGSPPSADDAGCAAHHRPLGALEGDLASRAVAAYNFISPDLCHDMHGHSSCPGDKVRMGDDWLRGAMPALIAFVNANGGVIFVTWDEDGPLPFLAVGPRVKAGYAGQIRYDHGSLLRSVEELLGLPVLPSVAAAADLGDLFQNGKLVP